MKTKIVKLFWSIAVVGLFGMISCKKDSVVENVVPNSSENSSSSRVVGSEYREDIDEILVDFAEFHLFQTEISKLAQQKSAFQVVKDLAKVIGNQQTTSVKQLDSLASVYEVMLPEVFSSEKNQELNKLLKTDSKAFDRQYLHTVIEDHTEAIDALSAVFRETNDLVVKEWAAKKLALLKIHLAEANQVLSVLQ